MNPLSISRLGLAGLFCLALSGLAGCGGSGSGQGTPTPAVQTLGPGAGSVPSSDGKVSVAVGDNALQSAIAITIEPATPDAATAADASLVPGTTYTYTAPDIQVPEQVLITIESPLAVAHEVATASAGLAGRKRALALPTGHFPPPTCLVNSPGILAALQPVQNIAVDGTECPAAPAPACIKVHTFGSNGFFLTLCAPAQEIIVVPGLDFIVCPLGYSEVTGDPLFAGLAAQNGNGRICQRNSVSAPPVLTNAGRTTISNCRALAGKFLCAAPKLPSGTYSVLWDKTPPPEPSIDLASNSSGIGFSLEENGAPEMINVRIKANDPNGLGGVELMEVLPDTKPPTGIADFAEQPVVQRWRADPAQFSATKVTSYDSQVFQIPYAFTDPAKRRFYARAYDRAGNSTRKNSSEVLVGFFNKITVNSFSVTPSSVQLPGGPVTISWNISGAAAASIDNGVGALTVSPFTFIQSTGTRVVNVAALTSFTLTATHPTRNTKTALATVTLGADTTPPAVALAASPAAVIAPGSTTLTATASDLVGVSKVEFYRGATLIGTDTTPPYEQVVVFTPADIGSAAFTAKAFDAANNSTTSAVVNVSIGADVTAPTVSLLANPATVLVPGSSTLQATASDAIGVTKVEFYRGATLIATDTVAPYQTTVNFTAADLGNVSFTAKAFDAQNNNATSAPAVVLVSTPSAGDTYASPTGIDSGNNACSQAAPCLTIAKAAQVAQANKTVWLMNGDYKVATQPAPIEIPSGLTLRALTPGLAGVGQAIVLQGSATVVGVVIRRVSAFSGDYGSITASSGSVTLDGVKVIGSALSAGGPGAINLSGSVQVVMTPGNIADYADQLGPAGQGAAPYATLAGSAHLSVNGGSFGGAALGGSADVYAKTGAFSLSGSSRLDINNAVVGVDSYGVVMSGEATQLHMSGSTLHANANSGFGVGVFAVSGTPQITLLNSVISGFDYSGSSRGISVGPVGNVGLPGVTATVSMNNVTVSANGYGIYVSDGTTASSLTLTGTAVVISANTFGGVVCNSACALDIAGGEVSLNGTQNPAWVGGYSFYGGLWFGLATKAHQVKLRNVQVVDNKSLLGGNSNQPSNSGLTMAGSAASSFDLGTLASPGGNLFVGNTTGNLTSGINVEVAAGVTVNAVGNTFAANTQQADAQGKYKLGTAPCAALNCNLTSGAGTNYRVSSGVLRLVQ